MANDGTVNKGKATPQTVDAYLAAVPEEARVMLQEMRRTIVSAAPDAVESVSYGIIGYKYLGRPLVYIGAAKKHVTLHAVGSGFIDAHPDDLQGLRTSKGGIQFPLGKPLPHGLIMKVVTTRMAENEDLSQKAKVKKTP